MSSARAASRRETRRSRAADDEALDAGLAAVALPAPGVVAAEDGALDDRLHLAVLAPSGSVSSSAHATVPPPRCARTARAAAVRRSSGLGPLESRPGRRRRARSSRPTCTTATGSASAAERASRPSKSASSLRTPQAARGEREDVGLDLGRLGGGQLDLHRRAGIGVRGDRRSSPVSIIARCAFGSSAPPPAAASRSGTAAARPARRLARGRRAAADAVVDRDPRRRRARGSSPTPRRTCASSSRGSPPSGADGVRAAPVAGGAADRRGDRPHGGPAAAARVRDARSGCTAATQVRHALTDGYPVLPILAELLRRRLADARARGHGRARRVLARGRVVRGRRRRAALPRRDRRRRRGDGPGLPRSRRPAAC